MAFRNALLSGSAILAAANQNLTAQIPCSASDATYTQNSDCSQILWVGSVNYSYLGAGVSYGIGAFTGSNQCDPEHTACSGSSVSSKLYEASSN